MSDRPVLSYGATRRVPWVRRIILASSLTGVLGFCALLVHWLDSPPRWLAMWDVDGVRSTLEAVPGVRLVTVYYGHDAPAFMCEIYSVEAWLDGGTDRVIYFDPRSAKELRRGTHLRVSRVGPYLLWTPTPIGGKEGIDLGAEGPFSNLLPFQVRSVDDIVNHYDDLVKFFGALPPLSAHKSPMGNEHEFHVSQVPAKSAP